MRITLRTRTALLATLLMWLLIGMAGTWQYLRLSSEYIRVLTAHQQTLSHLLASDLEDKLTQRLDLLALAARDAHPDAFHDPAAQRKFLEKSLLQPTFDVVAWIGRDGVALASDPPEPHLSTGQSREFFRKALAGGTRAISAPFLSPIDGSPAVWMLVPIRDDGGRLVGAIGAALLLERSNALATLAQSQLGRGSKLMIETGGAAPVFVLHPDPARRLQPVGAALPSTDARGSPDLGISAPIKIADWTLRVVLPDDAAFAPITTARQTILVETLLVGLACGVLAWLGTTWLMRPVGRLCEAIRVLRQSPESPIVFDVGAHDEQGDLAREIDALMTEWRNQRVELAAVTDASPLGLFRCNAAGKMIYVNDAYLALHGLDRSEAADGWLTLIPEDIRTQVWNEWARRVKQDRPFNATSWLHRRDGSKIFVSVHMRPISAGGQVTGHVGALSDITERTRAAQALRTLTAIFETTTDYVVQIDKSGGVTYMNPAARRRAGMAADASITGLTMAELAPTATVDRLRDEIVPAALKDGVWVGESSIWDDRRACFPVSQMVIAHRNRNHRLERFSAIMRDISEAKATELALRESEARLRHLASHDVLTGLGNRSAFERRLSEALDRGRGRSSVSALLYLDIDHFKQVNDRHGHPVGDELLKVVGQRISRAIRQLDFAARIGGDEFNVLMEGVPSLEVAERVAHKILRALAEPIVLADLVLRVSTSIGVALHDGDETTAEQWIAQADQMLYAAKAAGRNNVRMAPAAVATTA